MKIFISWSQTRSKHVALALYEWLPNVIQSLEPFFSDQSIVKGERGTVVISDNLEQANFGIICLTPENLKKEWILFEAGALSKIRTASVCTYLFDLEPSNIAPPLGEFQHTRANQAETKSMLFAINKALDKPLSADRLRAAFEIWWPKLDEQLKLTPPRPDDEAIPPQRTPEDKLDEVLRILRSDSRRPHATSIKRGTGSDQGRDLLDQLTFRVLEEMVIENGMDESRFAKFPAEVTGRLLDEGLVDDRDGKLFITDLGRKALTLTVLSRATLR